MDWFPDMFWLFLEWWLWPLLGVLVGLAIGWYVWRRGWRTEQSRYEREVIDLRSRTEDDERELLGLRGTLGDRDDENRALLGQVDELTAELAARRSELDDVHGQLGAADTRVESLTADLATRDDRIEALEAELAERVEVIDLRDRELAEQRTELQGVIDVRGDLEAGLEAKEMALATITSERDEKDRELVGLRDALSTATGRVSAVQQDLLERDDRLGVLEAELEARHGRIGELEIELDGRAGRIAALEADLEGRTSRIAELEADLDGRAGRIVELEGELDGRGARIADLESELAGRDLRIAELDSSVAAIGSEVVELRGFLTDRDGRIGALEGDIAGRDGRVAELEGELAARSDRIAALESDLSARAGRVAELESDLGERDARIGALESDLATRSQRLADVEASVEAAGTETAELRGFLGDRDVRIGTLEGDLGSRDARIGELEADIQARADRIGQLGAELDLRARRIGELEADLEARGLRVGALEADLDARSQRIAELEGEAATGATRLAELELQVESALAAPEVELAEPDVVALADIEADADVELPPAAVAEPSFEPVDAVVGDAAVDGTAEPDAFDLWWTETWSERELDYEDDLQEIEGVGPAMDGVLREQQLTTFYQVALLDEGAVDALEARIDAFPGRVRRDEWVPQAADLHLRHHGEDLGDRVVIGWSEERQALRDAGHADFYEARLARIAEERPATADDDLQRIKGVGPTMESMLHDNGLRTFYQLALLDDAAVDDLEGRIDAFPGRIRRDNWVPQAAQQHFEVHGEEIYDRVTVDAVYADEFERQLAEANRGRRLDYVDDLQLIKGVGPKMEGLLHEHGLTTFLQVSLLDGEGVAALNDRLEFFPGRILRDRWVEQAGQLHRTHHGD